jgi:hypothetical protein
MPIDYVAILRVLQILLEILQSMPARADHRPVATAAAQMIESHLAPASIGGTQDAES